MVEITHHWESDRDIDTKVTLSSLIKLDARDFDIKDSCHFSIRPIATFVEICQLLLWSMGWYPISNIWSMPFAMVNVIDCAALFCHFGQR